MKKTLIAIIAGIVLGSTSVFAATMSYSDVPLDQWYSEAVSSLSDKGILSGYPDGTFGPSNNVNRAELAVTLDRLIEYIETGEVSEEPLSYSTNGVSATVSIKTEAFGYTTEQLLAMADECGNEQTESYFNNLVSQFSDTNKTIYDFEYQGDSQDSGIFVVTLLPNAPGYSTLEEFQNDFSQCYAGGDAHPIMLNDSWLLFVNSCGSGVDDASGRPHGCQEVSDVVRPTLKLN